MAINISDYVPHGLVVALGGIVSYVFREHTARDDARFNKIADELEAIQLRQTEIADKMGDNHSEILRVLLSNERNAERRG
jgi:alcohol dehydrogenase class IV